SRVDLADGIALVVLAGEQRAQLQLVEVVGQGRGAGVDLRLDRAIALLEAVEDLEVVAYPSELGRDLARLVLVVPQVGPARLLLQLGQPVPRRVDLEISAGVVDAAAEIGQQFCEVAHREGCGCGRRGSATVAVLELLTAPAVARLVATRRL